MRAAVIALCASCLLLSGCGTASPYAGASVGASSTPTRDPRNTPPPSPTPTPGTSLESPSAFAGSTRPESTAPSSTVGLPTALPTSLSAGTRALITDADAGRITSEQFVRWSLTKLGYLDERVPARYLVGVDGAEDALTLSFAMNAATERLSAAQQAAIQADVDAYTHG